MSMDDLSPITSSPQAPAAETQDLPETVAATPIDAPMDALVDAIPADLPGRHELATQMVAKLCHDFISPAGAIMSGLDLLEDPSAQDMKQEALNLIATSAKKLVALVYFARVAFGASNTAESFAAHQLNKILNDIFASLRAELDFRIDANTVFDKPASRALLNLGYLAGNSLAMGGKARLESRIEGDKLILTAEARGPRARLKPEAAEALAGKALSDGLAGQWIQPHWLHSVVSEAGGELTVETDTDLVLVTAILPA